MNQQLFYTSEANNYNGNNALRDSNKALSIYVQAYTK